MRSETTFKIVFGVRIVLSLGATGYAHRKAMREHDSRFAQAANKYKPLVWICVLLGVPFWTFPIDWLASAGWFPWASVALPMWARGSGAGFGVVGAALMWWTMIALGSNDRGAMGPHAKSTLITHAPYRLVRHPMNAVSPLVSIFLFLVSANWALGAGALILIRTMSIGRAPIEERQLIELFGEEYRAYLRRTGRFCPRFR